jgi:hypothetical protein
MPQKYLMNLSSREKAMKPAHDSLIAAFMTLWDARPPTNMKFNSKRLSGR